VLFSQSRNAVKTVQFLDPFSKRQFDLPAGCRRQGNTPKPAYFGTRLPLAPVKNTPVFLYFDIDRLNAYMI
jgi:hypothetical protein